MNLPGNRKALNVMILGLIVFAGFQIALRLLTVPVLHSDFVQGLFSGVALGFEIIGLVWLKKSG